MKIHAIFGLAISLATTALPVNAQQNGYGYQPDPQVLGALNEMLYTTGMFCQMGDQQSCRSANYLQQFGNQMLQAGAACQSGNQQACAYYQQSYQELDADYSMMQQQLMQAQTMQPPSGYGTTHEQRMQQIQNFGAQNTRNWQDQQLRNEQQHQRFIDSIRQ